MKSCQPGGRGRGRRRQVNEDFVLMQEVENAIQPTEREGLRIRLQPCPTEHAHGDEVHAGTPHQRDVFLPNWFWPLLRVVVAAVCKLGKFRSDHGTVAVLRRWRDAQTAKRKKALGSRAPEGF